jgi:hypothetical protein
MKKLSILEGGGKYLYIQMELTREGEDEWEQAQT